MPAPLLEMRQIVKSFGSLRANDRIDFEVRAGETHALLGENGAGKTTLMNILYGLYQPDSGEIYWKGEKITLHSPRDAIRHRIGMIHQHLMLVPNLTVLENVLVGLRSPKAPLLPVRETLSRLEDFAVQYGLSVDPARKVKELPLGLQQRVEILKALFRGADLLILDEPTAVLSPLEVEELFAVLKNLVSKGVSIIFISHKLDEVLRISDRITVLRQGKRIGTLEAGHATREILTEMMVGRSIALDRSFPKGAAAQPILELKNVSLIRPKVGRILKNISLTLHRGEILGVAGIDGNGQEELADVVCGLIPYSEGQMLIEGCPVLNPTPQKMKAAGLGYVPADRQRVGLVRNFSVAHNLVLKSLDDPPFNAYGFVQEKVVRLNAQQMIAEFDIRATDPLQPVEQLSGGNQQKVILGRELKLATRLLVAVHPTRGLDVGATESVRRFLYSQKERGVGILLISADLDELLAMSDRIAVMFRGEILGIVPGERAFLPAISRMMLGEHLEAVVQ
ncbi:MAG: ABC transporter ATP-binding protein [Anaerolineales bacterium]|nr:ABC transporter ATP-binding protein [Anaerolineales bacterium]MCS7248488.1 ABC transporter ATP-binding protein [Anaerolineales bacterium]MDW8162301.1 ABC transporter ATP-binding protein [Anaerolineales bacterium]MDW8448077.1 ABC transporter ATP-binding protein [Anaerolineales bacterium]